MRLFVLVVVAAMVVPEAAWAGDGIVLESYTGSRPANAKDAISPVLDELAARGFIAGPDVVGRKYEAQVSRPAVTALGLPATFAEQIEKGHRAWISGKFDEAVAILGPIVDAAHANSGTFAKNPGVRDRLMKAMIALALSLQRNGDPTAARETFAELLRSFPEAKVTKGTYGPEAASLYEQTRQELAGAPRGRLLVKLANEAAEVFINERLERKGTTVKELPPGDYRVIIQLGDQQSRTHRVVIKPNEEASLNVDLAFDATVHSSPSWTGFEFATTGDREKSEAGYASAFANAIDGRAVVVVGIDQVRGRPAIVGSLVSLVNGREIRRASLALEPAPAQDRLRALARFLAGEEASADIDVQIAGDPSVVKAVEQVRAGTTPSRRWGGWTWITGVAALGGLGAGTALLALDGTCPGGKSDVNCPNLYSTAAPGWISLGAGAVFAGVTVYLIVTRPKAAKTTAYVLPTGDGAVAGFATQF
jgi:hypothetical protein